MKKKILIVEDNLAVNKALQMLLEPRYETIPAMDGKQAVKFAATELPDLILMDIIMPHVCMSRLDTIPQWHMTRSNVWLN